jgi:hypothetical protein
MKLPELPESIRAFNDDDFKTTSIRDSERFFEKPVVKQVICEDMQAEVCVLLVFDLQTFAKCPFLEQFLQVASRAGQEHLSCD